MPDLERYRKEFKQMKQDIQDEADALRRGQEEDLKRKIEWEKEVKKQESERITKLVEYQKIVKPRLLDLLKSFNLKVLSGSGIVHGWNTVATPPHWEYKESVPHEDPDGGYYTYKYISNAYLAEYCYIDLTLKERNRAIILSLLEKEGCGELPGGRIAYWSTDHFFGPITYQIPKTGLSGIFASYDNRYKYRRP